ncbi:SDR family oxidoreductase [Pseudomonas sp. BGI-2]|uniref:UDP-glucose 4-epimerase family protein n=1 Tax=Pseudomonas sp. BGI-2 TaxID=2528211 RepID=UPI001033D875|nr:SDR family oxidoreductase [Pseudomonas sp. BGI-2]TBN43366.1 SDR family oxidoreductase [Pseudomonas sp. BGI-2]
MSKVLLTGASGFLGKSVLQRLISDKQQCTVAVRSGVENFPNEVDARIINSLDDQSEWLDLVNNQDVVIHCAARVHVMNETAADPLVEFRKINVMGTLNLARAAAQSGVKRFIFISSIKVNGESTKPGQLFSADDLPAPCDPYGVSKMEAEQGLRKLSQETGMEVVIIRPVLIYGPGVKSNFRSMMISLRRGVPLPLGSIRNKRSLVALDNLVDLIATCISHPNAANQTFLASDGEDVSTPELLIRMGKVLDKPARLIPVPSWVLYLCAALVGRSAVAKRLCGSLQVDISKTCSLLHWKPPYGVDEALAKTAHDFTKGL